jgi:hypothetical protein
MADWGAKVTIPGKSTSSTDKRDYSLWTKFYAVMRLQTPVTGTATITVAPATTTVNIAHGLGYVPYFQVFIKWNHTLGNSDWLNATNGADDEIAGAIYFIPSADATNIILTWENNGGLVGMTADYKVIVGRDPLT